MRSIFLLRWGTGGPLNGQGALARPGPRMRAAFGLPEPPASVSAALARGSRSTLLRKGPLPEWAETCPLTGPCARADPLARDETEGGAPGAQGRAGGKARVGGRCSRRPTRARSWAGANANDQDLPCWERSESRCFCANINSASASFKASTGSRCKSDNFASRSQFDCVMSISLGCTIFASYS